MHSSSRRTVRKGWFVALVLVLLVVATKLRDRPRANRDRAKQFVEAGAGQAAGGQVPSNKLAAPQRAALAGNVADAQVSVERGFYETPITVELRCATPGAVLRYTTDGSEPGATRGIPYADPIEIGKTTVLRVVALKQELGASRVGTHTYVFPRDVIDSRSMRSSITKNPMHGPRLGDALRSIPSVSLATPNRIVQSGPVGTSFEWLGSDGGNGVQEDCGVVHFGGAFTTFEKESFRLYFRSAFGASKLKFPIFKGHEHGLAAVEEFDQLELRSGSHDMVQRGFYMSNIFADDTMLEMGQLNPHGRFVHLYLNGVYWGVYHLRERWGAGMHHRYLGGSSADYESINGNLNVGGWAPGVDYDGDGGVWKRVQSFRGNYREVRRWVDLPQYIDFMLVWIFGRCEDEYRCVGPTVPGSGFKFYINDADGFFQSPANPWYGLPANRTAWTQPGGRPGFRARPNRQPGDGPGGLFSGLLAQGDPDYLILLADRIYKAFANGGALTPAKTAARLKLRCEEMELPFVAEAARWGYRSVSNWESVRDDVMNRWLPLRSQQVLGELKAAGFYPNLDAPTLNQQGGPVKSGFQVLFTGPSSGKIFYTIDGSDPRLPAGGVAQAAKNATAPVPGGAVSSDTGAALVIDRNTVLKCRAREGNQWSALNESFFQVGPEVLQADQVVIKGFDLVPGKDNGAECIELSNVSLEAVNLRGAHFSEGIQYAFPDNRDIVLAPSQQLVLVRDLFRFHQTRGLAVAVEGIYSRKVKKHVERVTLSSNSGKVIASRLMNEAKP